jgi:putative oxidoreductase
MNTTAYNQSHHSSNQQWGLALLRISFGVMWIAHALLKLLVFTLPGTASYFEGIGLPGWLAYVVFTLELLGGIALVLGIYARQVALALLPIMIVATWVHIPNGWVHTSAGGGWEYPLFLSIISVVIWSSVDDSWAIKSSRHFIPKTSTC